MRLIELTNIYSTPKPVFVNVKHIGAFSRSHDRDKGEYTNLGVTTHNNGGYYIKETPEEIIELIKNSKEI